MCVRVVNVNKLCAMHCAGIWTTTCWDLLGRIVRESDDFLQLSVEEPPVLDDTTSAGSPERELLLQVQKSVLELRGHARRSSEVNIHYDLLKMDELERHEATADALVPHMQRFMQFNMIDTTREKAMPTKAMMPMEAQALAMDRAK